MNETAGLKIQCKVQLKSTTRGRKRIRREADSTSKPSIGRIPRVSRLMALAIRFEDLLQLGKVKDYAELAQLGHVTRTRVTQIMNLLNLAPDIQEQVLFLPPTASGRDQLKEWEVRPISAMASWQRQRKAWRTLHDAVASR